MANPQPDKYTKISNELLDALIRYRIPGEQMQVFLCVMRKTYGFNKKKDEISLTQFEESTGLKRPSVSRAIKALVTKRILRCSKSVTGGTNVYEIIKDFDQWVAKVLPSNKTVKKVVTKKIIDPVAKVLHTKDIITKEKKERESFYPDWLDMDLWKAFLSHRKHMNKNKPISEQSEKINITELKKYVDMGYTQEEIINKTIAQGWKGFFKPKDPPKQQAQQAGITYKEKRKREDQELIRMIQEAEKND